MEVDPLGTEIYTTGELAEALGECLRSHFPDTIMVQGEVSDLKRSQPGHVYFNLVEPAAPGQHSSASLPVALFSSNKKTVNALLKRAGVGRIQDGMPLRIRTSVDFYAARGTLTLAMSGVDPTFTLNALSTQRELLLERLLKDGVDQTNKRLAMPRSPQRIGLITSVGSAAYADFTDELSQSPYSWDVVVIDSRVQGPDAEKSIVSAIQTLTTDSSIELIVLVRGGGSRGDLATFDSEEMAHAIAKCRLPVLTGVGHEIDTSIADVVCHRAYKTPTACAVALNELVAEAIQLAEQRWQSICRRADGRLDHARQTVKEQASIWSGATTRSMRSQEDRLTRAALELPHVAGRRLNSATERLATSETHLVHQANQATAQAEFELNLARANVTRSSSRSIDSSLNQITGIETQVRSLDPRRAIARGWSITRDQNGDIVRSVEQADRGSVLVTTVSDGQIRSQVESSGSSERSTRT